ncbi:MAG: hypothetical protein ACE5IW_11465 [bacterium]
MRYSYRLTNGLLFIFSLLFMTTAAYSQSESQKLIVLHESIGPTIDARENDRYHLFSKEVGLIAAKLYFRSPDHWLLHVMGEKDGTPYMLVRRISSELKRKLEARLRFNEGDQNLLPTSHPVYPIELPVEIFENQPVKVRLVDNTELLGTIKRCTVDTVHFVTLSDITIAIPESKIMELRWPEGKLIDGEFRRYDPNHNRLFFGPTGRTLRAGEVNFADFYVIFPTIAFGVTDFFMLGGGVSLVPGAAEQLFYISPKVRFIHGNKYDLAAGLLYMGIPGEEGFGSFYSALSVGDPSGAITLGVAFPFTSADTDLNSPAFLFGAEIQVSNSAKLITENWFLSGEDESLLLLSGGIRFFGERLAAAIGLVTTPEAFGENGFPFIPWVDFAVSFGK